MEKEMAEVSQLSREAAHKPWDRALRTRLAELCEKLGRPAIAAMWRRAAGNCLAAPGQSKAASAGAR
jgi:hypothetical protein